MSNSNSRDGKCKWKVLNNVRILFFLWKRESSELFKGICLFHAIVQSIDIFLRYISCLFPIQNIVENISCHVRGKVYYPFQETRNKLLAPIKVQKLPFIAQFMYIVRDISNWISFLFIVEWKQWTVDALFVSFLLSVIIINVVT